MTPEQCRSARAMLRWSQDKLAGEAGVGVATVRNFESGRSALMRANCAAVLKAFEDAGLEFIPGGVRRR